jgi:hypothetical protein
LNLCISRSTSFEAPREYRVAMANPVHNFAHLKVNARAFAKVPARLQQLLDR